MKLITYLLEDVGTKRPVRKVPVKGINGTYYIDLPILTKEKSAQRRNRRGQYMGRRYY